MLINKGSIRESQKVENFPRGKKILAASISGQFWIPKGSRKASIESFLGSLPRCVLERDSARGGSLVWEDLGSKEDYPFLLRTCLRVSSGNSGKGLIEIGYG